MQRLGVGVCSGLSAKLANERKFDFLWVSSFELSISKGLPDSGLITSKELADDLEVIARNSSKELVVDLDSGHGDPLQCFMAADRAFSKGASAVCIEDHGFSKRSSLDSNAKRSLAPIDYQVEKLNAAYKASTKYGNQPYVIARTEALVCGESTNSAIERLEAYIADGNASSIFVQNTSEDIEKLSEVVGHFKGKVRVFVTPTCYSHISFQKLYGFGVTDIILANYGIRTVFKSLNELYEKLELAESVSSIDGIVTSYAKLVEFVDMEFS